MLPTGLCCWMILISTFLYSVAYGILVVILLKEGQISIIYKTNLNNVALQISCKVLPRQKIPDMVIYLSWYVQLPLPFGNAMVKLPQTTRGRCSHSPVTTEGQIDWKIEFACWPFRFTCTPNPACYQLG